MVAKRADAAAAKAPRTAMIALAALAWLCHAAALAGVFIADEPQFGWSLGLSITAWTLVAIYALESGFLQRLTVPAAVWWLAAAGCLLVLLAPPARAVPADANLWFTAHWVLGLAAYALFAAAAMHGMWLLASDRALQSRLPTQGSGSGSANRAMPLLTIEKLMMRLVWAGFLVLSLSLLLGVVLGEQLTGKPTLKADYKTTFSVLSWCVFAGLLLMHHLRGLRGKPAVKWLLIGSVFLLLGYAGSRFVLDVILGR